MIGNLLRRIFGFRPRVRMADLLEENRKIAEVFGGPGSRFSRSYSSPTGVECEIFFDGRRTGCVQGISISVSGPGEEDPQSIEGSMIFLVVSDSDRSAEHQFLETGTVDTLIIQWRNEYGHAMWCGLEGVKLVKAGTGISIDDITCDINVTYRAERVSLWKDGIHPSLVVKDPPCECCQKGV